MRVRDQDPPPPRHPIVAPHVFSKAGHTPSERKHFIRAVRPPAPDSSLEGTMKSGKKTDERIFF